MNVELSVMNQFWLSLLTGVVAGGIDVIPMLLKKLPKASCVSAFIQYVVVSLVIFHINLPGVPWWFTGSVGSLAMALPVLVLVAGKERKSVPVIAINALVLGFLIALVKYHLGN